MSMMSKVIKGRGKISFHDEKDREKMNKKYPEIEFEKMNPLKFTATYKGNKQFEVEIKVGDTKIPCSMNKWALPWKYGTKVELRLYFKDLKKKATTHITGGIQNQLFKFFRYDYEKMIKDDPKLQKSLKLNKKKSKLTTKQKKKMNVYLIEKYGYKKWAEDEDPELGKEYNRILKNPDKFLKGGCGQRGGKKTRRTSKKDKYICYTGIGSNKSGNYTKKNFFKVMNRNKYNFNEPVPKEIKTIEQWIKFVGAERGKCTQTGGKRTSKKDKTVRNKYKKISGIDCAKKHPKSRDKTLKCLDQKIEDFKSLESEFPQEMKILKEEIKDYEKMMPSFLKEAGKCKKHTPDMDKVKKCFQEVTTKYKKNLVDDKEMGKLYSSALRDKLNRMVDHTQKVDLGELGKLNL